MSDSATRPADKRVLIITASVGAGHNSVARAISESLAGSGPINVTTIDSMDIVPSWFRKCYAGSFTLGMTRLPWVYGLGYVLTNRPQGLRRGLQERTRLALERRMLRRLRDYLLANRFDLLVHTHFLTVPPVARMKRRGMIATPHFVTVTDVEVHRWWYSQEVDHWFAPSDYSAQTLRRWGVAEERITISGMPIHPKWTAALDRGRICAEWGLPADEPVVLLTGGTDFVCGPVMKIARGILDRCGDAHVVVLAGRNKHLLEQVSATAPPGGRLRAVPFTDRGHELAEVCSLMVTKAGGVTTAECLARGTPMVLLKSAPGHEAGNARFLACNGAAVLTSSADDAVTAVARLLACPGLLKEMSANGRRLYRPGREIITRAILAVLGLPVQEGAG